MPYYAQLTPSRIVSAVSEVAAPLPESSDLIVIDGLRADLLGKLYEDGVFKDPPSPPPTVPASVTMRQARLALHAVGKLAQVDAAINTLPEPQQTRARIEWEYSSAVQRHNGFVSQLGPALGMTPEQIDALFIAAAAIQ